MSPLSPTPPLIPYPQQTFVQSTPQVTPDYHAFLALPNTDWLNVQTDQLQLQLTGGIPTDDSPYAWPLLRLCIQEAYDAETADVETFNRQVLQADYLTRKKDEIESYYMDLKAKSEFWEVPERWIQTFAAPLLYDADRQEQYFLLPPAFVALRRYQNLPAEDSVRDVLPRNRALRDTYRFTYLPSGVTAYRRHAGGLLGRWGFYREQSNDIQVPATPDPLNPSVIPSGTVLGFQHRVYLTSPKPGQRVPDSAPLLQVLVLRNGRTSGLPAPPLRLVLALSIQRRAMDIALLRTRADKADDSNPTPTQST